MILCALLIHYNALVALPEHLREVYVLSNTNTCQVYSKRSWEIIGHSESNVTITNGVIQVSGYLFEDNKEKYT